MARAGDRRGTTTLELTSAEIELIRTALKTLLSALGKEEADEIDEIQAVLARLPGDAAS
jgi:hypothetical protein